MYTYRALNMNNNRFNNIELPKEVEIDSIILINCTPYSIIQLLKIKI